MPIVFPLRSVRTTLGWVVKPLIPVDILTSAGYRPYEVLLDTGADCTMLPKFMARLIGVDLAACRHLPSYGIEGAGVMTYASRITARIGRTVLTLPCLFSENERSPFILGRMGLFDRFSITFDNRRKKIVLTRL